MKIRISISLLACLAASCTRVVNTDSPAAPPVLTEYEAREAERIELIQSLATATAPEADPAAFHAIETDQVARLDQSMPRSERLYLIRMLGLFGDETSVEALVPLLSDDDPVIRDGARRSLSLISGDTATRHLEAGLMEADSVERAGTIDALAYSHVADAAPEITPSVQSDDATLTISAALALGKLGASDGVPALMAALDAAPPELVPLIESTLLSLDADADLTAQLAESGSNVAIRAAAFQQLNTMDPSRADVLLRMVISQPDFAGRDRFLSDAMAHGSDRAREAIVDFLPDAPLSDQMVILAAMAENGLSLYEPQVLALLPSAEGELTVALIETLSWIGGDASFQPVYQAYLADPREPKFAEALSRLRAPSADEKILDIVQNSADLDARVAAVKVLGLRNSPGATNLLNTVAAEPGEAPLREAACKALETIGDLESIQILANLMLVQDPLAKAAQRSLWRLSLNYGEAELLWDLIYRPAIQSAPNNTVRTGFVFILDGVACEQTLNTLETILGDPQSGLRVPALGALKRWPSYEALSVWILVASDPEASSSDIAAAESAITNELKAENWRNNAEKINLAVEAIQKAPNAEFKRAILDCYQKPNARQARLIQTAFKAIENDPDVGALVAEMLGDDPA